MSDPIELQGRSLHQGRAAAPLLKLSAPLSFWGGVDPTSGRIIDQAHPQAGESMGDRIVAMPGSRGSSGTPGVLGEALRSGVGPVGLIVTKADVNLLAGAIVAESLYGVICPVIEVTPAVFEALRTGDDVVVDNIAIDDGVVIRR